MRADKVANVALFVVTAVELGILLDRVQRFEVVDWIYLAQHLLVLGIALTRDAPRVQDRSLLSALAVVVSYAYPYAQVALLRSERGDELWPTTGTVLVTMASCLSLASLITLGRGFGLRPALRRLVTTGPYQFVRHPIYLAYLVADVGYNLLEVSPGTVVIMLAGWASLVYRILAEERILSQDEAWTAYRSSVRYRLVPWLW
jgi:protein-S-isoprenylcysteine O-methyltransferase Ste14